MIHGHSPSSSAGTDASVRSPAGASLISSGPDADAPDIGTRGGDRSENDPTLQLDVSSPYHLRLSRLGSMNLRFFAHKVSVCLS